MQPVFTIKEAILFGWKKTIENFWFFAILTIVVLVFNVVLGKVPGNGADAFLARVINFIVSYFVMFVFVKIGFKVFKGEKPVVKDIFDIDWKAFGLYLVGSIISIVLVSLGFIVFIIPGFYLSIRLGFFAFAFIDQNLQPVEALKKSMSLTKGRFWKLCGFSLVLAFINIVGVIAFGIGILISIPLSLMATVFVYEKLKVLPPAVIPAVSEVK